MGGPVDARRVVSRDQVVRGACRFFVRHGGIDMDGLADSLAISRATLYRVAHTRDGLLGDALWRLADRILTGARQQRTADGVDGVLQVTRSFVTELRAATPFCRFLRTEPDTAARVLFNGSGGVHRRAVSAQKDILREARWSSPTLDQAAYLYVRIVESALYAELLGGPPLDPDLTERTARSVLATG